MEHIIETLEYDKIKAMVLSYASCSLGKEKIETMKAATDLEILTDELHHTGEVLLLVHAYGKMNLGGLKDIRPSVKKARIDGTLSELECLDVARQTEVVHQVLSYMRESEQSTPYMEELTDGLVNVDGLYKSIHHCISDEGYVVDLASSKLAQIRHAIAKTEVAISRKMNQYLVSEKDYLSEQLVTYRHNRMVIPVKIGYQNKVKGIIHASSSSHQTAYIEPEDVVKMNNEIEGLKNDEREEVRRILFELSQKVKDASLYLLDNQDIFAQLDFLMAKASFGCHYDGCMAQVVDDFHRLYLKNARHPLIDQSKVVSNTIELSQPQHLLLITGSNTGGKTVCMKTVGLLTYMSLCGLPIPCDEAVIPFFDAIYCDLGDHQSIEQSLSTFSSHMSKIVEITENVTPYSLVLVDELGSGTDPLEGESIAQAVLEYLHDYRCFTIATTHYSSLKQQAKLLDYVLLGSVHFDEEAFMPTYQLVLGQTGRSYALEISKRLGLNPRIIEKAQAIKQSNQSSTERLLEKLELELDEAQHYKNDYIQKLAEANALHEKYEASKKSLDHQREAILEKAKDDCNDLVASTRKELDAILESFKEKGEAMKLHEVIDVKAKIDGYKHQKDDEPLVGDESFDYHVGDRVKLLSMNREASVVAVKKNELQIDLSGIKMQVKKKDVAYLGKHKPVKVVKTRGTSVKKTGAYEINVIGMRYEEAMATVDKFIDDALVANYPSVRIIHGVGTGALRKGVHQLLKKHKQIESFKDGGPNEGGLGATLAYFK